MPVTSTVGAASFSPARASHVKRPAPQKTVTAAPFTPAAQKQAAAVNTGRQPHRGQRVNIKV